MFVTTPAQAYLDPGTGSMVLQAVAAAIVAAAIFWRNLLGKAKRLLGLNKSQEPQKDNGSQDAAQK